MNFGFDGLTFVLCYLNVYTDARFYLRVLTECSAKGLNLVWKIVA